MKDSQRRRGLLNNQRKYIKADNERFSTYTLLLTIEC